MSNAALKFYKYFVSPLLGSNCRFQPSCSAYAQEAFEKHGILTGLILTTGRVFRCNPWHGAPLKDPVPERIDWRRLFRYKRP
jgi:putative membrane protein insertion efficiency factor